MTDISEFGFPDDTAFVHHMLSEVGLAAVPGSSFYSRGGGKQQVRFCFCKKFDTLDRARVQLGKLKVK